MKNGKGIIYSNEGDMEIGDYLNDNKIGKHIIIYANGNISSNKYEIKKE